MNPAQQFDVHPDAEILNGFVEKALPAAERAEVLAHLGGCSRCRRIVYLAQDAIPGVETPASAPMVQRRMADGERAWFLHWRTAWVAAFAFAMLAAFAIFLTGRHGVTTQEVARVAPSPTPLPQAAPEPTTAVKPAQNDRLEQRSQPTALRALAPKPASRTRAVAGAALPSAVATASAPAPPPSLPAAEGTLAQNYAEAKSFAPPQLAMRPAARAPNPQQTMAMRETHFQSAPQPLPGAPPAGKVQAGAGGAPAVPSAAETVEVTVNSAQLQTQPMAPAQVGTITPLEATSATTAKKSGLIILPSGLPLVSTAEAGHTQLAIDAVGTLFLSRDLGKNWQPIERQWTGRLMKVRIAPALKAGNSLLPVQAEKEPAQTPTVVSIPAALFEIVNDKNAVWTSADGKTWTAK